MAELERRKVIVLEVATQLFVEHGYAGTSLVDIAKRAGVATRTVYQHFGDKEAIFREVIYARRAAPLIPDPILVEGATLFDTLKRAADMSIHYTLLEQSVDLMRLMVAESRRFPELMSRVANATFARFSANIAHVFEGLAERGQIPDGDHAESAQLFLDLILGNMAVMNYMGWRKGSPDEATLERKIDLFILGRFGAAVAKKARTKPSARRRSAGVPGKDASIAA